MKLKKCHSFGKRMPRKKNSIETVTITISTTKGTQRYLEDLVSNGLSGKNPAEAAERLLTRGIENLVRNGTLGRRKLKSRKRK